MEYLLTPIGALALTVGSGLLGWFGKGLAAVLWRWWTNASQQDKAAYYNSLADLGVRLQAAGMTVESVRELEAVMRDPSLTSEARPKIVEAAATTDEIG